VRGEPKSNWTRQAAVIVLAYVVSAAALRSLSSFVLEPLGLRLDLPTAALLAVTSITLTSLAYWLYVGRSS
jgi:hypothetical protein